MCVTSRTEISETRLWIYYAAEASFVVLTCGVGMDMDCVKLIWCGKFNFYVFQMYTKIKERPLANITQKRSVVKWNFLLDKIEINDIAGSIVNFFLSEMDYMPFIKHLQGTNLLL